MLDGVANLPADSLAIFTDQQVTVHASEEAQAISIPLFELVQQRTGISSTTWWYTWPTAWPDTAA